MPATSPLSFGAFAAAASVSAIGRVVKPVVSDFFDIVDPRVFEWRFYVDSYGDLLQNHITDRFNAEQHWQTNGLKEGRQAHPGFHSRQYLERYDDVRRSYGADNYQGAVEHYIKF